MARAHKSLRINFILYNLRSLVNVIIPLIIFPYVTRALGPVSIGKVDFINSFASWFVLFSSTGFQMYGLRAVARVRNSKIEMSKTVAEISVIVSICTILCYIVYFVLCRSVASLSGYSLLLLVVSPNILLSGFNYEWFFQAIEDQLYITIRFLIVKALQVTLILLLVHQKDDYVLYAGLLVGLNSLASFFYVVRLRNYIGFIPFGDLNIWRHLKPSFFYFVTSIAASIGSQLDVTMIGFICGDKEVGYYSTSMKLIRLVVSVTSSVNMVVAPRCENIVAEGKQNEFKNVVITSLKIVLGLSFPLLFGVLFCSADVIHIIAGNEFEPSINYLRLLSLLITVQVISGVLAGLVLYPHKKEKEYSLVVIIGAIVNFSTNFVLIPRFASMGAIFASLLSEICALGINLFLVSRILPLSDLWDRDYLKYMVASMLMYGGLSILPLGGLSITVRFLIEVFVGAGVYFVFLALFREKLIIKMVSSKLFKKAF